MEFTIYKDKKKIGEIKFIDNNYELESFDNKMDEKNVKAIVRISFEKGIDGSMGDLKRKQPIFYGHHDFLGELSLSLMGFGYIMK